MCGLEAFARDVGAAVLALLVERIEQMVGFFLGELDDFFTSLNKRSSAELGNSPNKALISVS